MELNQEGIILTDARKPGCYDEAIKLHEEAINLTEKHRTEINPDYKSFSEANKAYALRHKDNDRNTTMPLLKSALKETEEAFKTGKFDETFFGCARLLEEMGLVIRYSPLETDSISDLDECVKILKTSVVLYGNAFENAEKEIIDKDFIYDHLCRTTGIISTVASELAEKTMGGERKSYLEMSVDYAEKELNSRIDNGESDGFGLLNAYHTLAAAQTEMIDEHSTLYDEAVSNLNEAKKLAENLVSGMTSSVLDFRFAWLEYKSFPENNDVMRNYLDCVISKQKDENSKWNKAVRDALEDKMFVLAKHLGSEYVDKISSMYRL